MLLIATTGPACRAPFRYPADATPAPAERERILEQGMNPFVLTNVVSDRVLIEVDWVEGATPHAEALARMETTLREYAVEGKQIVVDFSDEIPLEEWSAAPGDFLDKGALLGRYLNRDPEAWDEYELIHVVYVPGEPEFHGWMTRVALERDASPVVTTVIFMFPEKIAGTAELWIDHKQIERAVLTHETGHVLGLVAVPNNQKKDNPRHCTEPQCVMTHQRGRAQMYNALPALFAGKIPSGYCVKCREDIAEVQREWAAQAALPASRAELVERLRAERRIADLRAQACWYADRDRWADASASLAEARRLLDGSSDTGATDDPSLAGVERQLQLARPCPRTTPTH